MTDEVDEIEWAARFMESMVSEEKFKAEVLELLARPGDFLWRRYLGVPTREEMFVQDLDFPRDCPP